MYVYFSIDSFISNTYLLNSTVSIGIFDGLHYGHKKIIYYVKKYSNKNNLPIIILFNPHPDEILKKDNNKKYLTTIIERIWLFNKIKIKNLNLIILPFNKKLANLSPYNFIKNILINKLKMKNLIIGYDQVIGKNKKGNFTIIKKISKKLNFNLKKIFPFKINNKIISSTNLKKKIKKKSINVINKELTFPYIISGLVINENNIIYNKNILPTKTIYINEKKILPKNGLYFVLCYIYNKKYYGMLNIVKYLLNEKQKKIKLYINIFNFNKSLYKNFIFIELIFFIRDEIIFLSSKDLINQLLNDKIYIEKKFYKIIKKNYNEYYTRT